MTTDERKLRLFFALWPAESVQRALAELAKAVPASPNQRTLPVESLHVTLAFLGSVPESRLPELTAVADSVAGRWRAERRGALPLSFDAVEYWAKADLLCAAATKPPEAAAELAEMLKEALLAAGFTPDLKPFRAHVTLARKVSRSRSHRSATPVHWSCDSFALVQSRTDSVGASYSTLRAWPLVDA